MQHKKNKQNRLSHDQPGFMLNLLSAKFPFSNRKWPDYVGCFRRLEVPAKTTILFEGEIAKKGFFIEKGCLRAWLNQAGKDKTCQFFFENSSVASIESFLKGTPSMVSIESLEPSVLWWISRKDAKRIIRESAADEKLRELFLNAMLERTFHYMHQFVSFIRDTPAERYANLLSKSPELVLRIPQHYIASYLGISAVHLSRIRSRISRKRPTDV